jgi:hypothetical protein
LRRKSLTPEMTPDTDREKCALRRFEPVAREQLKQVVTNRVSQFFTADSFKIKGRDPLVIRFLYAPRRDAMMIDPTPLLADASLKPVIALTSPMSNKTLLRSWRVVTSEAARGPRVLRLALWFCGIACIVNAHFAPWI